MEITEKTLIVQLTAGQLVEFLRDNLQEKRGEDKNTESKKLVYGLSGLKNLLGCSHPTAQRIKDSGKIPFQQIGRKLIFDSEAVLRSLEKKKGASK